MRYYHVTTKENAKKILKEGLVPQIGANSLLCGEEEPYIYLCGRKDVPFWKIILGETEVLCINLPEYLEKRLNKFEYSEYQEFLLKIAIPAECIRKCQHKSGMKKAMKKLCASYIYTLGDICVEVAKHCALQPQDREERQMLASTINATLKVLHNLDFSCLSAREIRDTIRDSGDGRYAFTDHYRSEETRLYQKISMFAERGLIRPTKKLTKYIQETFPDHLYLETGGWC